MPGLTLLNIDREKGSARDPLKEIREIITEISAFTRTIQPDSPSPRLVPLRMKLKQLQDAVSQFGSDGSIAVDEKQSAIMELHPDLQFLANELGDYGQEFFVLTEICMNFLLNHLCSSAASDPKSTVIGVSNVMAQVLSSDMQIVEYPEFTTKTSDLKYFDEFARIFNSMLTTAGLFAAPVLGLPDIPISALGNWSEQALSQFAITNKFVRENFDPYIFYQIDKFTNATPFDTVTDILSFYVYENEFLAALIARADLLSGLEFRITENNEPVKLQSTEEITFLLASTIDANCSQIDRHLATIDELYLSGKIDRNEKPSDHPHLMVYRTESKIWRQIATFAILLVRLFELDHEEGYLLRNNIVLHVSREHEYPPLDSKTSDLQKQLFKIMMTLEKTLFEMFPQSLHDTDNFIQSSDFTKFRDFLQYIITIVAANDVLLQSEFAWTPWLLNKHGKFFLGTAVKHNPLGAMQVGIQSITLGLLSDTKMILDEGIAILDEVKPHLEFQMHHLLVIQVMKILMESKYANYKRVIDRINAAVMTFLEEYQINPNSMLFQRSNLYMAMLAMYNESAKGEFLRKENERFVAFDPFSWIQVPRGFKPDFPYMPLNTSIDNLNSG
ncbi:MAG: hypothetical protein ACXAD7_23780 [Candidatus Kariarchaeaceae archaeon]